MDSHGCDLRPVERPVSLKGRRHENAAVAPRPILSVVPKGSGCQDGGVAGINADEVVWHAIGLQRGLQKVSVCYAWLGQEQPAVGQDSSAGNSQQYVAELCPRAAIVQRSCFELMSVQGISRLMSVQGISWRGSCGLLTHRSWTPGPATGCGMRRDSHSMVNFVCLTGSVSSAQSQYQREQCERAGRLCIHSDALPLAGATLCYACRLTHIKKILKGQYTNNGSFPACAMLCAVCNWSIPVWIMHSTCQSPTVHSSFLSHQSSSTSRRRHVV